MYFWIKGDVLMEEKKSFMDRVKKILGIAVMAGTIAGASGNAIANQINNEETDHQFISEFYEDKPTLQFADYRSNSLKYNKISYGELRISHAKDGMWVEDLEKQYNDIMQKRKMVCNSLEEYEKSQLEQYPISEKMLSENKSKTPEAIREDIESLIRKDLVSLDTPNDSTRINALFYKLDKLDFSKMSPDEIAVNAAKLEIEIQKNREMLKNKRSIMSNDKEYITLQEQLEKQKEGLKPQVKANGLRRLTKVTPERVKLMQEQAITEAKILLRDTQIEYEALQMTYSKDKEQTKVKSEDSKTNTFKENLKVSKEDLETNKTNNQDKSINIEKENSDMTR